MATESLLGIGLAVATVFFVAGYVIGYCTPHDK